MLAASTRAFCRRGMVADAFRSVSERASSTGGGVRSRLVVVGHLGAPAHGQRCQCRRSTRACARGAHAAIDNVARGAVANEARAGRR